MPQDQAADHGAGRQGSDGDRESLFDEALSTVGGMLANRPLYLTGAHKALCLGLAPLLTAAGD